MKHSRFFVTSLLALLLGAGAAVGAGLGTKEAKEAKADTSCYVRGRLAAAGLDPTDWTTGIEIGVLSGSEYQVLNQIVYTGDAFKFVRDGGTWLGYGQIESGGAKSYFTDTGDNGNITVSTAAKFNFYVKASSIWTSFVEYVDDEVVEHTFGLIGKDEDWSADFATFTKQANDTYQLTEHFDAGDIFKIRADAAWTKSWGVSAFSSPTNYFQSSGDNIEVLVSGTYTITLPSSFYDDGNNVTFTISPDIADGYYLRGKYQGVTDWDNNIALSNATVTESISYNSTDSKLYATLELFANDVVKFVRYSGGLMTWVGAASVTPADATYYPASADDKANLTVTNPGIYYISAGYDNTSQGVEYWWMYVDNSASAWAYTFLNSMTCNNGGQSPLTWNIRTGTTLWEWDDFAKSTGAYPYSKLDDYAKNTFYSANSSDAQNATNIEKAVKRHDVCVNHYGWNRFITNSSGTYRVVSNAAIVSNGLQQANNSSASATTIITIVASVILLGAVGGYFIIKRKHEN